MSFILGMIVGGLTAVACMCMFFMSKYSDSGE